MGRTFAISEAQRKALCKGAKVFAVAVLNILIDFVEGNRTSDNTSTARREEEPPRGDHDAPRSGGSGSD